MKQIPELKAGMVIKDTTNHYMVILEGIEYPQAISRREQDRLLAVYREGGFDYTNIIFSEYKNRKIVEVYTPMYPISIQKFFTASNETFNEELNKHFKRIWPESSAEIVEKKLDKLQKELDNLYEKLANLEEELNGLQEE